MHVGFFFIVPIVSFDQRFHCNYITIICIHVQQYNSVHNCYLKRQRKTIGDCLSLAILLKKDSALSSFQRSQHYRNMYTLMT